MRCDEMVEQISAYIDGELPAARRQAIAAHIAACPECAAVAEDYRSIGTRLVAAASRQPPTDLAARISARLDTEPPVVAASWLRPQLARQVALVASVAVVAAFAGWHAGRTSTDTNQADRDVVSAHVRALLADGPTHIASADTHTVKPWFSGRLDFSPVVKDLASEGFPLVGGRLDYLAGRRVAAVVYKRRQHTINLFMWPAVGLDRGPARTLTLNGYNAVTWSASGMTFWAVSDLNAGELSQLQGLL